MDMSRQVALVTGANRGFGRHLALELQARGATVYAGARRPETVADLPGMTPVRIDITDTDSVASAAASAPDVTLLINNAGGSSGASLMDGRIEDIRADLDTHFFGTLSVIRAFAPQIAANGGGAILNVLSAASWIGKESGSYPAAKAAEWSLTNSLRLELVDRNIRVVGLHVGFMETDLAARVDAPKSDPAEIAKIAVDGLAADLYEVVADERSRQIQQALNGGVAALYPQLP